jgi:hypothetical protein
VRYACHIANRPDSEARRLQRAHCRLSTRPRTFDEDIQLSHAHVHGLPGRLLTGKLCRVGCTLSGTLEAHSARTAPRQNVSIGVSYRNDRVVEGRLYVRLPDRDIPTHAARSTSLRLSSCHLFLPFRKWNLLSFGAPLRESARTGPCRATRYFLALLRRFPGTVLLAPLFVRALVLVRWPRTGRLRRWRRPL